MQRIEVLETLAPSIQALGGKAHAHWLQAQPQLADWLQRSSAEQLLAYARLIVLSDFAARVWPSQQQPLDLFSADWQAAPDLSADDLASAQKRLRRWRQRNQLQLIYHDLLPAASARQGLQRTLAQVSLSAEQALVQARDYAHTWHYQQLESSELRQLLAEAKLELVAMGKLGAHELNLSSDVDLILVAPITASDNQQLAGDLERFYLRCARSFIALCDQRTADGQVLRIDTRLRPFGNSGALVLNKPALLNYYREHGREWERYALVKARLLGQAESDNWLRELDAFVYRPFRDFRSYRQLRQLRELIAQSHKLGAGLDIKRCSGGIRDAEFIVQALQLIHGGRYQSLQQRGFFAALQALTKLRLIAAPEAGQLSSAYVLLRHLEHKIQALDDKQSHIWPEDATLRARIAFAMGTSAEALQTRLEQQRAVVEKYIDKYLGHETGAVVVPASDNSSSSPMLELQARFAHHADTFAAISAKAVDLERQGQIHADYAEQLQQLLSAISGRGNYLALLAEVPQALATALKLMTASPWLSEQILRHPLVLENFATRSSVHPEAGDFDTLRRHYQDYLDNILAETPSADLEAQMDSLRRFKLHSHMHVARLDLLQGLELMQVSDQLSAIADALIMAATRLAWQQLLDKWRVIPTKAGGQSCSLDDFLVVALGKLGGIELGYGSDCDLVFVYDADSNSVCLPISGAIAAKQISNQQFFLRLGQRIIHLLSSYTTSGRVFELDLRLRPQGSKGLLVSSLSAYADYQLNQAWIFETQALSRARPLRLGSAASQTFAALRQRCLQRQSQPAELLADIISMRQRINANKAKADFDVKLSPGGLVDIEFLVQYLLLLHAHQHPQICAHSDNWRQLQALQQALLISPSIGARLRASWLQLRHFSHQQQLHQQPAGQLQEQRNSVINIWRQVIGRHWSD